MCALPSPYGRITAQHNRLIYFPEAGIRIGTSIYGARRHSAALQKLTVPVTKQPRARPWNSKNYFQNGGQILCHVSRHLHHRQQDRAHSKEHGW